VAVKIGSFVAPSSGGAPQSQSISGLGFPPKVLIIWTAGLTAENSFEQTTDIRFSMGFSNSTQERGVCYYEQDASDPTNTRGYIDDDVYVQLASDGSITQRAKVDSLDSDGFTIGWDVHNNVATILYFMAIGGADITDSDIGHFISPASTPNQIVSGLGLTPSIVFLMSTNAVGTSLPVGTAAGVFTLTAFSNADNHRGISISSQSAIGNSNTHTAQINSHAWVSLLTNTNFNRADFVSLSSGAFEIDWQTNVESTILAYMAIEGGDWAIGHQTLAAATGNQDTALGFTPEGALVWGAADVLMYVPATTNIITEGLLSMGASDGASHRAAFVRSRDAQTRIFAISRQQSDVAVLFGDENATPGIEALATLAFPTNTFRSVWSDAPVVNTFLFYVALRGGAPPAPAGPPVGSLVLAGAGV